MPRSRKLRVQRLLAVLLLFFAAPLSSRAEGDSKSFSKPVFAVDVYDPQRDPVEDLQAAVTRAQAEDRRILIILGGNWCPWCRRLAQFIEETPAIAQPLAKSYLVMKVNWSRENPNGFFLRDFPNFESFPHLYVLDSEGKVRHSQATEVFEKSGSYDERKLAAFLEKWADASQDAK